MNTDLKSDIGLKPVQEHDPGERMFDILLGISLTGVSMVFGAAFASSLLPQDASMYGHIALSFGFGVFTASVVYGYCFIRSNLPKEDPDVAFIKKLKRDSYKKGYDQRVEDDNADYYYFFSDEAK